MTQLQLSLTTRPTIEPFPESLRDPVYLGFAFGPKDKPADIAADVVQTFVKRKGYRPREIQCHPSIAECVEKEVGGIPVVGCGRAARVLLLGPLEFGR